MQISTEAVVVRERALDEQDKLLTLLTPDRGLLTAYAKNARKLRGSMASATELLCYSHFQIFQNRDSAFVDKAESNAVFFGVRQDIDKLSLATYFCQLCCELVPEGDGEEGYLRLLLNSLHLLEKGKLPILQLKAIFELRMLAMAGYMPDLVACYACGDFQGDGIFFAPSQGTLRCSQCVPEAGAGGLSLVPLSPGVFQAMRHIIYSDFEKLFAFRLSQAGVAELSRVCQNYLLCQVERVLPALHFFETMFVPSPPQTDHGPAGNGAPTSEVQDHAT